MTPPGRPDFSVVLPAYNLGPVIADNVQRVRRALAPLGTVEIVVVDDGSTDRTYQEATRSAADLPMTRVIRHDVNRGKGEALFTGARATTAELVLFLDADLDLPPEQVLPLVGQMEGVDLLVGAKRKSMAGGRYPLARRILSRIFTLLTVGVFRLPVSESQTGLKILRRPVIEGVLPQMRIHGYAYDLEMLLRAHRSGMKLKEAAVELGESASTAPLRVVMLWQMGRDTLRLWWWTVSGRIPRGS
ncbi:MAG: glycosyltransferase family 2 protein [Acidimicrobiia bacterium]